MKISRIQSTAQLSTNASPTGTQVTGSLNINSTPYTSAFDKDLFKSYARKLSIYSVGASGTITLDTPAFSVSGAYVAPVAQSTKAVAVGTVTTNGTLTVTVTSNSFTSGSKILTINLTGLPIDSVWANTVREALNNSIDVSSRFVVSGTGTDIIITRIVDDYGYANDATLNLSLISGTVVGITNVTTSTSMATGALATGAFWDNTEAEDAEGTPLPTLLSTSSGVLVHVDKGEVQISDSLVLSVELVEDSTFLLSNPSITNISGLDSTLLVESNVVPAKVTIIVVSLID